MNKYNILVATPYSLFPTNSGGRIHVLSSLKPIADRVNLHLLAFLGTAEWDYFSSNRAALLAEYYQIFQSVNFIQKPLLPFEMPGKRRKLFHFLKHTLYGLPLMDVSFYDKSYIRKAKELIRRYNIELIEAHQLHVAFLKRFVPKCPVIVIEQNREHELWPFWTHQGKRFGDKLWNQFGKLSRKFAYQIEVENTWKLDARCFISLEEMKRARLIYGKIFWLPPGVEVDSGEKTFQPGKLKILWVGGFDWFPNAEGAIWFTNECWPLLKDHAEKFEFHFIGSNPPQELTALHDGKSVFVHGYVEDIEEYWKASDVFIVPLRSGGGIRIKIVEALNNGIPVVTTRKGCEGMPYEPGIDLLVADDPNYFVKNIFRLCDDLELRYFLSHNGKNLIKRYFSLSEMGQRKLNIYREVLGR